MVNKISTIFDLDDKGFKNSLKSLGTEVRAADGFVNKLKVGASGLADSFSSFIKSGPGIAAVGAGIGLAGKFAIDAVSDFSALGVEVGQLADATGLSADAASRWIEVAGDIGIESGTLETGLGKLNKAIALTPELFSNAGVEIAKTASGATDVNGTFLNLIKRLNGMRDPAERAALAQKTLGKGWQGMAELIGQGSDQLTKSLSEVADAKVFDDDKIQKARDFRKATDALSDSMQEFTITMGTELAPAISDVAAVSADLLGVWGKLFGGAKDLVLGTKEFALGILDANSTSKELVLSQKDLAAQLAETDRETRKIPPAWELIRDAEEEAAVKAQEAADAAQDYQLQVDKTSQAVQLDIARIEAAWDALTGNLDREKAWINLQQQARDVAQANIDAGEAVRLHGPGSPEAIAAIEAAQLKTIDLKSGVFEYGKEVVGLPEKRVTELLAMIDSGSVTGVLTELDQAFLTHTFRVNAHLDNIIVDGETHAAGSVAGFSNIRVVPGAPVGHDPSLASGTARVPGALGQPYPAILHGGETVIPAGGNGSGGNTYVTVNMPVGSNGDDMMRTVKKWENRNGPAWRK